MKKYIRKILPAAKTALKKWWDKDPFKESAVIAYYAIFSLPGLLVVILNVAGYFFGNETVNREIQTQVTATMGADASQLMQNIIAKGSESKNSVWATIIGVATIIFGATGVFAQFQKSINTIWEVEADETKSGIWSYLRARLFSFGLIIAIAFLLIVSLVISAALTALGTWITQRFSESLIVILQVLNFAMSYVILALLFALMFKYFPDAKIKWRHVLIGASVTTFFFQIGKTALSLYFGTTDPGSSYGAAGSVILILLWVSYTSMIVFYGAEFTHAFAELIDGKIPPDGNAVRKKVIEVTGE